MKSDFPGYYPPSAADYEALWEKGVFIFDTNTLLHLYRVPEATRKQMLGALRALKGRVWIPRHVGVEFQARRLSVIKKAHHDAALVLRDIDKALGAYQGAVDKAELEERGVSTGVSSIKMITEEAAKLRAIVEKTLAGQLSPTEHDEIRDQIDRIFEGKVGVAPASQAEVEQWNLIGKERFKQKRGPGFADAEKAEGEDPQIYAQGITYERQYGDLYIWLQILDEVRARKLENVVFITRDIKEDWWRLVPGSEKNRAIVSPLESLTEEIYEAGAKRFWMYQLTAFLQEAEKHLAVKMSDLTIKDAGRAENIVRDAAIFRPGRIFQETDLQQALGCVATSVVYTTPRIAAGYRQSKNGIMSAEIIVPLRVAARSGAHLLAEDLKAAVELVELHAEISRLNVYVLALSKQRSAGKDRALSNAQRAFKAVLPDGVRGRIRFAIFSNSEQTELETFNYDL
ncbi:PIN-like domain-containing protein [Stenotrophomonas indicatrix]|uniref:PIN-like domain-containing protein n=1 Tax=Stenotrophomonas indicatrix TaxID=2045451 RepID=UPI000471F20A|nr:PIN-like domain-containing protein [Stenotrophomonas indicatrix]